MALWPFRRKSQRRRTRRDTFAEAEAPPRAKTVAGVTDNSSSPPGPGNLRKRRTESNKLHRRARAYSFSPGRSDSIDVARRRRETPPPVPKLPPEHSATPDSSRRRNEHMDGEGIGALGDDVFQRVPTLGPTRGGSTPRKSSKRRREEHEREAEIKAWSSFTPMRPATDEWTAGRPMKKDSKRVKTMRFGGPWRDNSNSRSSQISLPIPESIHSTMSSDSEHVAYKVSALEALAPRPTIRYASFPPNWRRSAGSGGPERRASQKRKLSDRGPIPEATLKAHKRIDDLADDLDSSDLRELMERDKRRRERKRQIEQERMERRLARKAEKQRLAEEAARARGEDAPVNLERGAMGREMIGLGIDPPSAVVSNSVHSSVHKKSDRSLRDGEEGPSAMDLDEAEEDEADVPTPNATQSAAVGQGILAGSLTPVEEKASAERQQEKEPAPEQEPQPEPDAQPQPNVPPQSDAHPRPDAQSQPDAQLQAGRREHELAPEPIVEPEPIGEPVVQPQPEAEHEHEPVPELVQKQRTRNVLRKKSRSKSTIQSDPTRSTISPVPRGKSATPEKARGGSEDEKSTARLRWSLLFKWARGKRDKEQRSFSNTSRDSVPPSVPPAPAPQPPVDFVPRKISTGVPKRTMSRFREDLPELPISPLDSRPQSPNIKPAESLNRDEPGESSRHNAQERHATPTSEATHQTPQSWQQEHGDAPSPEPPSISLASIDSEASWLSGRLLGKRPAAMRNGRSPYQHQHRRTISAASDEVTTQTDDDQGATEDEYVHPLRPSPQAPAVRTSTNADRMSTSEARPSTDDGAGGDEGADRDDKSVVWGEVGKQPTVIHPHDSVKSREAVLKSLGGFDDERENESDDNEDSARPHRAESVDLGKGHARPVSAGSGRLLQLTPRASVDHS